MDEEAFAFIGFDFGRNWERNDYIGEILIAIGGLD